MNYKIRIERTVIQDTIVNIRGVSSEEEAKRQALIVAETGHYSGTTPIKPPEVVEVIELPI